MKKSTRILKRYLATFLIVLMSIESFAAVVGDNDGAAFITKAEFDSMKNDFQVQLDKYNKSIDNKIDGAIASYLAGLRVSREYKLRSTLEVAGQTYEQVSRKSYVFTGNDSTRLLMRYNKDSEQFANPGVYFNSAPYLLFRFTWNLQTLNQYISSSNGNEFYGPNRFVGSLSYYYVLKNNDGNPYGSINRSTGVIFLADRDNYVFDYKLNAGMAGNILHQGTYRTNVAEYHTLDFTISAEYPVTFTFKDVVGANGTNGMGYSTRNLNWSDAVAGKLYLTALFANNSNSRSGWTYTGISMLDRDDDPKYIMYYNSIKNHEVSESSFNSAALNSNWTNGHLHFDESRFGQSYAWCMPFSYRITNRTVPVFNKWPAWDNVGFMAFSEQNVEAINDTTTKQFSDDTGHYSWWQQMNTQPCVYYDNGVSRTYHGKNWYDYVPQYININGMLPYWKTNPMKNFNLLKNSNIKTALNIDCYYAKAPALTSAFEDEGSITWVAKVQQEDDERFPYAQRTNWGETRIYFANGSMDDLENDGTNISLSNSKSFKYKKYGTSDPYTDCLSETINGKLCYYAVLDHDIYYEFTMDVEKNETVYYMICDMDHLQDYCLEVYEHPNEQITFVG